jgi:esterase/lipase
MEILEFGNKNKKKIILIHGFQSPYQLWEKYIEHYKTDFHVIVPIMHGHNPKNTDDFISFYETAKEFEEYYISRYGEEVYAVYGMSMGGVLAATVWQNQRLYIEKVIFDGSPILGIGGMVKKMMHNFYLNVTHKSQKRDKKTLEQAVKNIIPNEHLDDFLQVLDNMSDTTITNCINDIANFKLSHNIDAKDTKIYFFHGTLGNEVLAKKSANYIAKHYSNVVIKCFKGRSHCETSIFQPEVMIRELNKVLYE